MSFEHEIPFSDTQPRWDTPRRQVSRQPEFQYVGFWKRILASLVDTVIAMIVLTIAFWIYQRWNRPLTGGYRFLVEMVFELAVVVWLWKKYGATPGKLIFNARVVDAVTGELPTIRQSVIRYLAYFVATVPLGLGFLWIGWDPRKQGFHDKIANTVVVSPVVSHVPASFRSARAV
jgi:uncharacterized RDD family membrane protein YckC